MRIQHRIALAQLPALVVLVVVLLLAQGGVRRVGEASERILADNYRSVLAAQRMKEAVERLDSAALFRLAGRETEADALVTTWRPVFEAELRVEEDNLTEPGEPEAAAALRGEWEAYSAVYTRFAGAAPDTRDAVYFEELLPRFHAVKADADGILALNQDAMVAKGDAAAREAERVRRLGALFGLGGVLAAGLAGVWAGARLAEPYRRLSEAAERVGGGQLDQRVVEAGDAESIQVARAFNRMVERLRLYRRASESEVVRAREAAQAAIDALLDPVVVLAPGGELRLANRAATSLLGLAPRARSLSGVHEGVRLRVRALAQQIEADGAPRVPADLDDVLIVSTPEGERAWLPHGAPMVDPRSGVLVGVTVLLQDVTRLRRLDQLKGDLVHTVAHELRTPLTSLGMALHLALDARVSGPLTDRLADLLGAARDDVRRLKTLVDDLLDLSRIQEGRLALRTEGFGAGELLADVAATWAGAADGQGVALVTEAPAIAVAGDRARLAVALGNLVANALRVAPAGSRVVLGAGEVEGGWRFWVDDAGPGVAPADRERIFERFERGAGGAPDGGTGLGLYIARQIVEAHGGRAGVEASPAGGARVWLELPRGRGGG